MKINHVALYTGNLESCKQFFEKYFGAKAGDIYHNSKTGFYSYFLSFGDDTRLEIMHDARVKGDVNNNLLGFAHLAFSLGDKESVDELTKLLLNDGYSVVSGPRTTGDGYYESCILDSEGNKIEITE